MKMLRIVVLLMGISFVSFSLASTYWTLTGFAVTGLIMRQTFESLFSIAALPVLMGICQRSIAAAQFGFYMALSNQADVIGIYLSGPLYNQVPAAVIGLNCGLVMVLAAALISIVGKEKPLPA